jgi:hypothetical protein
MKWNTILGGAALACAAALIAWLPVPQDRDGQPSGMDEEQMAAMKRWQEMSMPGKHHEKLADYLGEWNTTVRIWMGGPGQPPMENHGTATYRWLMDGRWLISEGTGSMMGMPVQHTMILGYDNMKKSYVMTKVDSISTTMLVAEGDLSMDGKALHLYGTMDEPLTGEHDKMVRYTTRFLGPDRFVTEVYDLHIDPVDSRVVEVEYNRKK